MTHSTLRLEVDRSVATVTMDRPGRYNAMTNLMAREMLEVLGGLARDPSVAVLVLTGADPGFCPGADLVGLGAGEDEVELLPAYFRTAVLLHEMPAVTIAAVNGACAGSGLGWAASCDLRYAARSATFSTAFLARNVAGDMGLPWTLGRLVGPGRARELTFFPDKFGADRAAADGLVNEVFDDAVFRAEVAARVERLRAADPTALAYLKANHVAAARTTYADFVDLETARHLQLYGTARFQEGVDAFRQ